MTESEFVAIRLSMRRDGPCGTDAWTAETASCLGLESSLRSRGLRPRTPAEAGSPGPAATQAP
jgi:hypothetical protein